MNIEDLGRQLATDMPDALVVADAKGLIQVWNAGAERIFGFPAREAIGQSLDIITPEAQRSRHWAGYEKTMKTGKTRYGAGDLLAVPALHKDGHRISIQFSILPIKAPGGGLEAIAAIMRDVTEEFEERKRLRRELAACRKAAES